MSSLIDQLNASHDAGTLDTFDGNVDTKQPPPARYRSRGRTSNPLGSGQMVSTKQSGFIPPEVAEAVMQANEEVSSGDSIGGTLAGVGVEMATGIGLTYSFHRSARYLNWLNNAKRVATLGVVAPEPTTTAAGLVGIAATEAAIWGFSNFLGQSTRKAFGVQDAYSAGEMIASSVFGVGLVATGVDKLVFKLAPGVGAMNAWKGKELLVHGTKTFVSGAALGLAESTMRQELEHAMNGKDRNVYDYLFSAGAGGTFNSLFSMYARTGKWGRQQAAKAAESGRLKLEADKAALKKQLTAATKGGAGQRNARIRKNINEIEQAQDVIDDTLNGINKADEDLSKAEALTEPVAKVEGTTSEQLKAFRDTNKLPEKRRQDGSHATQVATTTTTYTKIKKLVKSLGKVLDFGAGKNISSKAGIKADTFEPFPEKGFDPTFTVASAIPDNSYDTVINNAVLNVVTQDVRDGIVRDIGRVLKPDGQAFINVRGKDVLNSKHTVVNEPNMEVIVNSTGSYQKGFTENELTDYLQNVLGDGFEVRASSAEFGTVSAVVTKASHKTGVPLSIKAFHGSNKNTPKEAGGQYDNLLSHEGTWSTASKDQALNYARDPMPGAEVKSVDVKLQNPKVIDMTGVRGDLDETFNDPSSPLVKAVREAREQGHDGVVVKNFNEGEQYKEGEAIPDQYVVFATEKEGKQIQGLMDEAPKVETDRDKALNALTERVENINSENFTQEQPLLELDVKKLYNEQETKRIDAIRRIADDGNDREALQSLLDEVVFTRKLNTQVKDRIETAGGRSVQAARRDAEKYRKTYEDNPYSFRSMKEDAALAKLERTLRERLDGADTEDILNLYDDYLAIKPRLKKEGKAQDAKERKAAKRKKKIEEDTAGDLDKTDEEIEAELKEKAEKEGEKRLAQLREELEKQQEIFTRQRDEPEGKQPREKSDEELDLERRIKFYKTSSREAKETVVLEEKLNKYLQLFREGDKNAIRQEVGPAPDWAKPAEVDSYLKRLRSLTNKVRKALKAEVTPKKVPTEAEKAAKLKEALKKKKATLQKQLDERRKRFGDDIELEQAQDAAKKPVKEEDPEVKDLQDRIKFYNQAEAEVATVERLEAQLARLADVEGRGVISELKDVTAPKPTGPTKPSQASIIRKKITASKKRMRDKLKDIDRVNEKEAKARIFADLENALLTSLETDVASRFTKFTRALNQARQLSLIDQLPSAMAGVPTGVGGIAKQFFRPAATFLYNLNKGAPVAWRLAAADGAGAFKTISTFFTKDNLKALKRTFSENVSATDTFYGKFSEDLSSGTLPQGEHAIIARAHANAKRQAEAVDNVTKKFTGWINTNNFWHILSLGVRSIQGLDEAFKRPLIKGRIWAESNKKAILEFPNNPMKARKRAEELYQSAWVDSNGLEVLSKTHEFYDEVNQVREELLFASNAEKWEDVYTPDLEDKIIGPLSRLGHSDSVVGFSLKAIMPYIGVPLRAVIGRGLRVAAGPLTVARAHFFNPYAGKIKEFKRQIEAIDEILRTSKDLTPESKKGWNAQIVEFTERMHTAQARALKFKGEALTDFFIGSSLMTAGAMHAASGDATGSLLWMTDDQRKKSGLNRFNSHNSNYAAAMPWSFPYAIGADVMMWWQLRKEQERTGEPLLTKEQDLPHVIRSSFVGLAREQPLTSGIKTAEELATGEGEVFTNALSRFLASYLSNPAQVRKVVQMLDSGGKVVDLRGASYWDRIAYHSLGNGPLNHKTDILGNDIESTKTWGTQAIMRQLPEKEKIRTELDKILATDLHQNVQQKPSMLSSGVKMTEYRNSDGLTLDYVFNKRLRETVIGRKTLEQAIDDLIYSSSWRKDFDAGWKRKEDNIDAWENKGLKDLNSKLQEYYTATRKQMTERKGKTNFFFLSDFVNKDGEYLDEVYERNKAQSTLPGATPRSVLDVLNVD